MLRLTRTAIGLLTRQYRSVLKKCLLINAGLFALGMAVAPVDAAAEVNALESTLDKIRDESLSYLSNAHQTYTLATTKGSNTNTIIIGGTKYYYTPNEGSAAANQKLVNLANTGGGALTSSTTEPDNYVFKVDNGDTTFTYYSYDTSNDGAKFAKSGIKISTTSTGAAGEQTVTQSKVDGTTVTYYINHVAPYATTGTPDNNLASNIDATNYKDSSVSTSNGAAALAVKSGTVDYITADFSKNSNTNSSQQTTIGGAVYNAGTIGHITGDFNENSSNSRGGGIEANGDIVSITGDFYGNTASTHTKAAGGAINVVGGKTVDSIVGNFINNIVSSGNDGGAINSDGKVGSISGSFVGNSAARHGGAINTYSSGTTSTTTSITGDFTDNTAAQRGGAIRSNANIKNISSLFVHNSAQYGGAIYAEANKINNITDSNFINNTASVSGGAIYASTSIETLSGEFSKNTAQSGGAIYNTVTGNNNGLGVTGGVTADFTQNTAQSGGAIYNTGITYTINGDFENNRATSGSGGAIYNEGEMNLKGNNPATSTPAIVGDFTGNTASDKGGAIFNTGDTNGQGKVASIRGDFSENSATYGGAIYNEGWRFGTETKGNGLVSNFIGNTASTDGGAIYNASTGIIGDTKTITGKFKDNEATTGSGGAIYNVGTIGNIVGVTDDDKVVAFKDNTAGYRGGAINNDGGGTIGDITGDIIGNTSTSGSGGAIFNYGSSTIGAITGDIIDNTSALNGGAIYNYGTIGDITGDIRDNTANSDGGAIYNNAITIGNIIGNITGNTATTGDGGAIYNKGSGTINGITGNVTGNRATSGLGGAIYTEGAVTIATDTTHDILFNDNKDSSGYNDIYAKGGTVNLSAQTGRTVTFNGSIVGTNAAGDSNGAYTMNLSGGNYVFNNNVTAKTLNLSNVNSLKLGTVTQADTTTHTTGKIAETIDAMTITGSGTTFDLRNDDFDIINVTDLTLSSPVAMAVDANLKTGTMDKIHATTIAGTGSFIIDAINVLIDTDDDVDSV